MCCAIGPVRLRATSCINPDADRRGLCPGRVFRSNLTPQSVGILHAAAEPAYREAIAQRRGLRLRSMADGGCESSGALLDGVQRSAVAQALLQVESEPPRSHGRREKRDGRDGGTIMGG